MLKQPDAFQLPHRVDFKEKYAPTWHDSTRREAIALSWLQLMGINAIPVGHGTLTDTLLPGFHKDAMDKFDLYAPPPVACFFEVTGTSWMRRDSAKRFSAPIIPVLRAKVEAAEYYGVERHLWFIAVADMQGEIRFLPCANAKNFPVGEFARGEGLYYLIPWDAWLTPNRAAFKIARRVFSPRAGGQML